MIPRDVKSPTVAIPFHKLLKVVAIVDQMDIQTKELLDQIRTENFEVEVAGNFDRDVSEDAAVGAYILLVDGDWRERARTLGRAVRSVGFRIPLWALADSHRISDMAVFGLTGEVDGYIYLGQQTPAFYAKQVVASLIKYGKELLPPFFGGLMAYDGEANIAFACPGHQGGQFYRKSPAGQLFFKHFGESVFRNDLCNADVDLGDLLIHEGPAAEAQRHAARMLCFRASSFPKLAISSKAAYEALVANDVDYVPLEDAKNRIAATLALIYPPGIGVVVPGERWDDNAKPMRDYFLAFEESFNRFPGFNYEVQGVFQEQVNGRIKFHTYVVRE